MKHQLANITLGCLTLIAAMIVVRPLSEAYPRTPQNSGNPVVVELFTSEGCSTCPPAEALLAQLEEGRLASNVQLIALEEHVDYWNDLGWVDPYSSREWTSRQYVYSEILGNRNPYTPQMVVDGSVEFVGNRTQQAREAILKAANKVKTPVMLAQASSTSPGKANFSVKVGKLESESKRDAAEVWLAITETGLHSAVTRGENAGENLHHASVVRWMHKLGETKGDGEISFGGDTNIPLQKEWKRENLKAVVFVQEKKSRRILGAAEVHFAQ
jgi:hypothetical protein